MSLLIPRAHHLRRAFNFPGPTIILRNRYHSPTRLATERANFIFPKPQNRKSKAQMAKKKSSTPAEENLLLPTPPSSLPIVDTHTHVAATFEYYRGRYKEGRYLDVYEFVKAMYANRNVEAVVDVWCEAPVRKQWKDFADSALDREKWGGLEYWFVMGTSYELLPN